MVAASAVSVPRGACVPQCTTNPYHAISVTTPVARDRPVVFSARKGTSALTGIAPLLVLRGTKAGLGMGCVPPVHRAITGKTALHDESIPYT